MQKTAKNKRNQKVQQLLENATQHNTRSRQTNLKNNGQIEPIETIGNKIGQKIGNKFNQKEEKTIKKHQTKTKTQQQQMQEKQNQQIQIEEDIEDDIEEPQQKQTLEKNVKQLAQSGKVIKNSISKAQCLKNKKQITIKEDQLCTEKKPTRANNQIQIQNQNQVASKTSSSSNVNNNNTSQSNLSIVKQICTNNNQKRGRKAQPQKNVQKLNKKNGNNNNNDDTFQLNTIKIESDSTSEKQNIENQPTKILKEEQPIKQQVENNNQNQKIEEEEEEEENQQKEQEQDQKYREEQNQQVQQQKVQNKQIESDFEETKQEQNDQQNQTKNLKDKNGLSKVKNIDQEREVNHNKSQKQNEKKSKNEEKIIKIENSTLSNNFKVEEINPEEEKTFFIKKLNFEFDSNTDDENTENINNKNNNNQDYKNNNDDGLTPKKKCKKNEQTLLFFSKNNDNADNSSKLQIKAIQTDDKYPPIFANEGNKGERKIQQPYRVKQRLLTLGNYNSFRIGPGNRLTHLLDLKTLEGADFKTPIIEQEKNVLPPNSVKTKISCNCKKSKCLKLYCECFAQGEFCKDCNCVDCHNKEEYKQERDQAMEQLQTRNPGAFVPKIKVNEELDESEQVVVNKGCNCKKSGCQKKYCECYNSGIQCSDKCKCTECKNKDAEYYLEQQKQDQSKSAVQQENDINDKFSISNLNQPQQNIQSSLQLYNYAHTENNFNSLNYMSKQQQQLYSQDQFQNIKKEEFNFLNQNNIEQLISGGNLSMFQQNSQQQMNIDQQFGLSQKSLGPFTPSFFQEFSQAMQQKQYKQQSQNQQLISSQPNQQQSQQQKQSFQQSFKQVKNNQSSQKQQIINNESSNRSNKSLKKITQNSSVGKNITIEKEDL